MATARRRKNYQFDDQMIQDLETLSKAWGGLSPARETDVIREALRRAADAAERPVKVREIRTRKPPAHE